MLDTMSSIVHCTRIDLEKGVARIVEGKRIKGVEPFEADDETEILEYKEMLSNKLREVYNAVGC